MGLIRYSFGGDEIVPQGGAQNQLDDGDFWAGVTRCGVAVAIAAAVVPVRPVFARDDDFVAPVAQTVVDEDYWPVAVAQPSPWLRLYLPDPEELPAGSFFGQYDEDFWQNPVAPVQATLYQRLPLGDPEEIPAGTLSGLPDEDFWVLGPRPTQTAPPQAFWDDSDFVAPQTQAAFEEDCWQPPVPGGLPFWVPAFTDDEVCVPQAIAQAPADEDFWIPPVPSQSRTATAFSDTDDLPVAPAAPTVDEDYWLLPVPASAQFRAPVAFSDADDLPAPAPIVDEDYWVPPPPLAAWRSAPFLDTDEIAPQPAPGQPDEDYWNLGPPPVQATLYQRLPYLPDPDEIPTLSAPPPPPAVTYVIFVFDD